MKKHYYWKIKVETEANGSYIRYYEGKKAYNKTDAFKNLTEQLAHDLNSFPFLRIEDITLATNGMSYSISKIGRLVSAERFER